MNNLAKSLSGHDKGHFYVIIKEDDGYVYLADGRLKTVDRPKRKNRKHIQIIQSLPGEVRALLESGNLMDTEVKRALKLWSKSKNT